MQLVRVCAALVFAAAAPGSLASVDLFCDCQLRQSQHWSIAIHCSRGQSGSPAASCQTAEVQDIPQGYHYVPGYALVKLYRVFMTWSAAKKTCEDEGAILAVPRDRGAFEGLRQIFMQDKGVYWGNLGITDQAREGIYVGVDGGPVSYLPWKPNEPNNNQGNEHCVDFNSDGESNDVQCDNNAPFFCERRLSVGVPDTYRWLADAGRFYKVHTEKHTHTNAASVCRSENAMLAVPDTWCRVEALLRLFEPSEDLYRVGFTDEAVEGDFVTETGRHLRDMGFQVWQAGEPNNNSGGGPENCLAMAGRGYYSDVACDSALPFICEIAP